MDFPDIRSLLPHTGRMVLLDRVIAADADNLCAQVTIRRDSVLFDGSGVGAWVGIEYMAQTIGAYAGYLARSRGKPVRIGFLLGTRRYESSRPSFPLGTMLKVHARHVVENENGLASFDCRIDDADETIVRASLTVFQAEDETAMTGRLSE